MNIIFNVTIMAHQLMNDGQGSSGVEVTFDHEDGQGNVVVSPETAAKFPVGATVLMTLESEEVSDATH